MRKFIKIKFKTAIDKRKNGVIITLKAMTKRVGL